MALVIEDGTVVAGANSFVSVADAKAMSAGLGTDDELIEQRLLAAVDYLESLAWKGTPTAPADQVLSWPRYGVEYDSRLLDSDIVPAAVRRAQVMVAQALTDGLVLYANTSATSGSEKFVKRKKVDVLETEFATPQEMGAFALDVAVLPGVTTLLSPLLRSARQLRNYKV